MLLLAFVSVAKYENFNHRPGCNDLLGSRIEGLGIGGQFTYLWICRAAVIQN